MMRRGRRLPDSHTVIGYGIFAAGDTPHPATFAVMDTKSINWTRARAGKWCPRSPAQPRSPRLAEKIMAPATLRAYKADGMGLGLRRAVDQAGRNSATGPSPVASCQRPSARSQTRWERPQQSTMMAFRFGTHPPTETIGEYVPALIGVPRAGEAMHRMK